MNVELNKEEINFLIECVTESKNRLIEMFLTEWDDENLFIPDVINITHDLNEIYIIKTKLCNYSIQFQEEN